MRARAARLSMRVASKALSLGLLACLVALAGCNTLLVGKVEPALFPAAEAAPAPPLAGRVALVLPPSLRDQTHPGPDRLVQSRMRLQLPLGGVVDAALQHQLGTLFSGRVMPAALPLPDGSGVDLVLVVTEARLRFDEHRNWILPMLAPPPIFLFPVASSTDYKAQLELDLRVTDTWGRLLVQTSVDSGSVVLERGQWSTETLLELYQKLLHQAAWQAAERAAKVAHDALLADRLRERPL